MEATAWERMLAVLEKQAAIIDTLVFERSGEGSPLAQVLAQVAELKQEVTAMAGELVNLQAADTGLQTEVSTVLADFATALANAIANSDPAAIQKVADDMNAMSAQLAAADPNAPVTPPAGGTPASA
jgi:hypothetical protein